MRRLYNARILQMNAPFHNYLAQAPSGYAYLHIIKQLLDAFSLKGAFEKFGKVDPIVVESFFYEQQGNLNS